MLSKEGKAQVNSPPLHGEQIRRHLHRAIRPAGDLTGREQLVERARRYVSSKALEIERLLHELSSKKAEIAEILRTQANTASVEAAFANLVPQQLYLREDPDLKIALKDALASRLLEETERLAAGGYIKTLRSYRWMQP